MHQPDNLKCDAWSAGSTAAIAIGVLMYESADLSFSPIGLFLLLLNLAFACAERMLQRHLLAVRGVS